MNPVRGLFGGASTFTPYAAGKKVYGTGRPMPTYGPIANKTGYAMRDGKAAARREALIRRAGSR